MKNLVAVLVDLENLQLNLPIRELFSSLSLTEGLKRLLEIISQEVGQIAFCRIFTPPHLATLMAETFHKQGLSFRERVFIVYCPKIANGGENPKDTADDILIADAEVELANFEHLTHLCLCAGDADYYDLVKKAIEKGIKIVLVPASDGSLAESLLDLVIGNPGNRVIIFPTQKE